MNRTIFEHLFAAKGIKMTGQRWIIIQALGNSKDHPDADQVTTRARAMDPDIGVATVYRTLEKFVSVGILERVDFQEGKFRYEFMHGHHHHAVCNSCGKVENVVDSLTEVEAIESRIQKESGFRVTKHALELFGICNKCQRSNAYA